MRKIDEAHGARIRIGAAGPAMLGRGQPVITVLKGFGARAFSISS